MLSEFSAYAISDIEINSPTHRLDVAVVIIGAMITALFGLVFRFHAKGYQFEMNKLKTENNAYIDEVRLLKNLLTQSQIDCEAQFINKFEQINRLFEIFYAYQQSSVRNKKLNSQIMTWVDYFNDDIFIDNLKMNLNEFSGGIWQNFHDSFPHCSFDRAKLFLFKCIGLSDQAISIVGNENIANVYSRKYRLRNMILESEISHENKSLFLEKLTR